MRISPVIVLAATISADVDSAQSKPDGPTDTKAQKTYKQALEELRDGDPQYALEHVGDASIDGKLKKLLSQVHPNAEVTGK